MDCWVHQQVVLDLFKFVLVNSLWLNLFFQQQGNNTNILERYSSFTRKENKPLFKIKASKKVEMFEWAFYILSHPQQEHYSMHVFVCIKNSCNYLA